MGYNMAVIRKLLDASFTDEDLSNFCHDYFHEIYEQFTAGQTKSARVRLLIDYAEHRGRLDELLEKVKQENSYQYNIFESQLKGGGDTNQSTGPDEKKPFSWGEFAGEVLKKLTEDPGVQPPPGGQQLLPSLDQVMPGSWQLQLVYPNGVTGQSDLEMNRNGAFSAQGGSSMGTFSIDGTWQVVQSNKLQLNGMLSDGYQTTQFNVIIQFSQITCNALAGVMSTGEQVTFQRVR